MQKDIIDDLMSAGDEHKTSDDDIDGYLNRDRDPNNHNIAAQVIDESPIEDCMNFSDDRYMYISVLHCDYE